VRRDAGMTTQARRALSGYPLDRARGGAPIRAVRQNHGCDAEAGGRNAKLKDHPHMSRYSNHRRKRDSSLCRLLLNIMANILKAAPYSSDCRGCLTFYSGHIARLNPLQEPRTGAIFELEFVCRAPSVSSHRQC
jgi:hypothetical protein